MIFLIVIYLAWAAVFSIPAFLLARYMPASRPWLRYLTTLAVFTLCVTPSLGSATISVASVPFAVLLLVGLLSLDMSGIIWTLQEWPLWHAVAFPSTLLVALIIFHRLRPNNSFKPRPLRGSA